jgi:hypothetical protein
MSFEYRAVPLELGSTPFEKTESDTSSITLEAEDDYGDDLKGAQLVSHALAQRPPRILWILQAILLTLSMTLFILSHLNFTSTLSYVQKYNSWSPAASTVTYSQVKYNLSTSDNQFVGHGPAVDRAWREISYDMGDQWISKQDMAHLGMPEWHLKVDNPKTGETGYRVGVEVFHQLHCLNLLRRVTYKDYYGKLGGEFGHGEKALQMHTGEYRTMRAELCPIDNYLDHCIEVIRHQLMCSADIGLFSLYMVDGDPQAWPELNTNHICRDFSAIKEWALENSVGNMEVGVVNDG